MSTPILIVDVLARVAQHHGLTARALTGPERQAEVVRARHMAMWLSYHLCPNASYDLVAKVFQRKDHTTVLHAVQKIDRQRELGLIDAPDEVWEKLIGNGSGRCVDQAPTGT